MQSEILGNIKETWKSETEHHVKLLCGKRNRERQNVPALLAMMGRNLSRPMGKPTTCIGENKGADQLRGNREADQRLCFRYADSTLPLLLKSEMSSF